MPATKLDKEICRIITPKFRVSYPHVFKAQAPKATDKAKYSITMLFRKDSDLTGVAPGPEKKARSLQEVIKNAKTLKFGPKENWPKNLESPVTDGDNPKFAGKDGYEGHWVIKAVTSADQRPTVVDRNMVPITDPNQLYPGCFARAYIYAYVWEYMGKQGVGFILDHVQKLEDGQSFGGKKPVEQVFSPLGEDEDSSDEVEESSDFK
jgi:Protein of unknown function (DUF2815)